MRSSTSIMNSFFSLDVIDIIFHFLQGFSLSMNWILYLQLGHSLLVVCLNHCLRHVSQMNALLPLSGHTLNSSPHSPSFSKQTRHIRIPPSSSSSSCCAGCCSCGCSCCSCCCTGCCCSCCSCCCCSCCCSCCCCIDSCSGIAFWFRFFLRFLWFFLRFRVVLFCWFFLAIFLWPAIREEMMK